MQRDISVRALRGEDAFERLVRLRESLAYCDDGLERLAQEFPEHVRALSGEVSIQLSELARSLRLHRPALPSDIGSLPPPVRAHWRQTQLICDDTSWVDDACDAELGQVLATKRVPTAEPLPLLERLARSKDARLRYLVLRDLADPIADLSLDSSDAVTLLCRLAQDSRAEIRHASVQRLAAPWLFFLSPAAEKRRAQCVETACSDDDPRVQIAALDIAAALRITELVIATAFGDTILPALRARAFEHLGACGREDHIRPLLEAAIEQPVTYGGAARSALLEMHRRGVFVRERELDALLALFDLDAQWPAGELVRVTHIVRNELLLRLSRLPRNDTRWVPAGVDSLCGLRPTRVDRSCGGTQ